MKLISLTVWLGGNKQKTSANFLRKGSLAGIEGRIQTSNFEGQDGNRVFMTEVVADSVQFLEPRNANAEIGQQEARSYRGTIPMVLNRVNNRTIRISNRINNRISKIIHVQMMIHFRQVEVRLKYRTTTCRSKIPVYS